MILTYEQIEVCADSVLRSYGGKVPLDVDRLATSYLGLGMLYISLSGERDILGLTTYSNVDVDLGNRVLHIPSNTCVIDSQLFEKSRTDKPTRMRLRFTLAHECAHQILYRMEPPSPNHYARLQSNRAYSFRELKSSEDWNEWQANALAAALLMSPNAVREAQQERLTRFGRFLNRPDMDALNRLTDKFQVSNQAMLIRLQQLGLLEQRAEFEYFDPTEIWNDEYAA
jgi:hypothetical protein